MLNRDLGCGSSFPPAPFEVGTGFVIGIGLRLEVQFIVNVVPCCDLKLSLTAANCCRVSMLTSSL